MKNIILNYLTLIMIIVALPIIIIKYLEVNPSLGIYQYVGLAIIIPSAILFAIARIQLGNAFQASAEAHKLVTTGLYKKIRNPIYIFGMLSITGLIIFSQKFYILIVVVALIFMQIKRIKNEEKVLHEKFGDKYLNYKNNTWF